MHATVTAGGEVALVVRWTADAGGAWVRSQVRLTAAVVPEVSSGRPLQPMYAAPQPQECCHDSWC